MDRKSIIVLGASGLLLVVWFVLVPKLLPPPPKPQPAPTNVVASTTVKQAGGTNLPSVPVPPPSLTAAPTNLLAPIVTPGAPEQLEKLETTDAIYTFTSHGGGLKTVELKKYREDVGRASRKAGVSNEMVVLNGRGVVPVLAVRGSDALMGDGVFKLSRVSASVLRAEKSLAGGLILTKEFSLGSNYLLTSRLRLQNTSDRSVVIPDQSIAAGTASSIGPLEDPTLLGAFWYNGQDLTSVDPGWFENRSFMGCGPSSPRPLFTAGASNVFWTAVHNQFFALAVLPKTNQPASQALVRRIELPPIAEDKLSKVPPYGYEASLVYPSAVLEAGQTLEREFTLYAGPKEYKTLSRFGFNLDLIMGYSGFFGWFAKTLLLSMNGLYALVPNYGVVIILITIIIKILFWPLTQASTRSMKRMSALQPQMKAIQEKYKEDPAKMNKKLMEFMKENKVSPMGGCLPMLLQIPVFFGFFQMIRSAIELRGARFLWVEDLSRPDTLFHIPGLDFPFNPLPLLMGVTMLWQARMTPPSPGMDPGQQKIMKYMPLIFLFMLYNFSAGLTLYWTVQNLLTIAQMKLTKTQDSTQTAVVAGPASAAPKKKKHS